jgi:Uroporphyrinogen decarboxylase (URO-D)
VNPLRESNINDQVHTVLLGRVPERIPFISRMDFWYRGLTYQDKMPEPYHGMSLSEIHKAIGFGQEDWLSPCAYKYRNMELVMYHEGQEILHEYEPEISFFPDLWGKIPVDRAGETITELITPSGKLVCKHRFLEESIRSGTTRPQLVERPVRSPDDFQVYAYMIEHSEFVPHFDAFFKRAEELDGIGYLVPVLNRLPFQSLLIDAIGEIPLFYALHDTPELVDRLIRVIDIQIMDMLEHLSGFAVPYVEFCDNLEGSMTNPRLFQKYLTPYYQRYSETLHRQGKKLGSHTDGDLKKLVTLLSESGLDVCESFTPAPITDCTFEEAWATWGKGPLIWGGIPSYYLEAQVPEEEFQKYIESILTLVQDRPVILGIGDAVMCNNDIERVRWIAQRLGEIRSG